MSEAAPDRADRLGVAPVTAEEFERQVASIFASLGENLPGLEVVHQDLVQGTDGDFVIDATVRFEALGGLSFLVLIEAKLHGRPVERSDVQVLREKMLSTGAQKGIVASNASFQRGALEFARVHGISLVRIVDEGMLIEFRGSELTTRPQPSGRLVAVRVNETRRGVVQQTVLTGRPDFVEEMLNSSVFFEPPHWSPADIEAELPDGTRVQSVMQLEGRRLGFDAHLPPGTWILLRGRRTWGPVGGSA